MFKLRSKGIANVNGRGRGDLFARLIVEVPSRLNAQQRRKLEEFAALCGDENTPLRKSFSNARRNFSNRGPGVSVFHNAVKLIECPRDAWQGLKRQIPTKLKARYLRALIAAGL